MDRDAIPSDLRDHREEIRGRYRIERLGLFGSAARDELTESSDVDVLVTLSLVFPWKQNIQGWAKPPGTAGMPNTKACTIPAATRCPHRPPGPPCLQWLPPHPPPTPTRHWHLKLLGYPLPLPNATADRPLRVFAVKIRLLPNGTG